ncbi:MAG: hypothetical protein KAY22_05600 [Rhizorhabdus sp.]|uniref:hypothetical protein n=1 Tax=Rhizorhabdus sp. TaxID=1968843 RepID=UPI001B6681A5|nr:hypothetical protein [Rhizorhabdus sp.]MBP8231760.1 hypothetical protein [Rhizorhabdus sp.]
MTDLDRIYTPAEAREMQLRASAVSGYRKRGPPPDNAPRKRQIDYWRNYACALERYYTVTRAAHRRLIGRIGASQLAKMRPTQ